MTARDPMGLKATIDLSIIILSSIAVVVIVIIIIIVMSSSIVLVLVASQRSPVTSHRSPSPPSPPLVAASTVTAPGPHGAEQAWSILEGSTPPPAPAAFFVFCVPSGRTCLDTGRAPPRNCHPRASCARAGRRPLGAPWPCEKRARQATMHIASRRVAGPDAAAAETRACSRAPTSKQRINSTLRQ